jgi:signal transduction histidine kinase
MEKTDNNFSAALESIKLNVTKTVYDLFIGIGIVTLSLFIAVDFLNGVKAASTAYRFQVLIILVVFISTLLILRFKLNIKTYKIASIILVALFFGISIINALISGTISPIHLPYMMVSVLTIIIIFNSKRASIFTGIMFVIFLIISYLHTNKLIPLQEQITGSDWSDTLILFVFIAAILRIAHVAYGQIEKSYSEALHYSEELKALNKELDEKVQQRTESLISNYERQIEGMHAAAVMGNITKPLLHDIATPISAMKGGIELLKTDKKYDPELIQILSESSEQMSTIVNEARDLMRGKSIDEPFDVSVSINRVLRVLKNEFNKYEIEIEHSDYKGLYVKGAASLFERIIINLLVNATDELQHRREHKKIEIAYRIKADTLEVTVRDNGRGIKSENLAEIFKEDFSLKKNVGHLGLGLFFVKKTMQDKFGGDITVESELHKYTMFILHFPLYDRPKSR